LRKVAARKARENNRRNLRIDELRVLAATAIATDHTQIEQAN